MDGVVCVFEPLGGGGSVLHYERGMRFIVCGCLSISGCSGMCFICFNDDP